MSRFDSLIGQKAVKNKLNFYIDVFEKSSVMPFLLFSSPKGYGKTEFARQTAKNLKNADGSPRAYLEINSSTIRNTNNFFDTVFLPTLLGRDVTVLFDEAHNIPNDFVQLLLTICNSDSDPVREVPYDGAIMSFDFTKITFMFATTEPDKIFPPLKDRMESVEFIHYTDKELQDIMVSRLENGKIHNDVIPLATNLTRGNPRSAVKMAKNIDNHCIKNDNPWFRESDLEDLKGSLGLLDYGILPTELSVLEALKERGDSSLTALTAVTGMSKTALQRDVEHYLMKKGFMEVGKYSKRTLTNLGKKVVEKITA